MRAFTAATTSRAGRRPEQRLGDRAAELGLGHRLLDAGVAVERLEGGVECPPQGVERANG